MKHETPEAITMVIIIQEEKRLFLVFVAQDVRLLGMGSKRVKDGRQGIVLSLTSSS